MGPHLSGLRNLSRLVQPAEVADCSSQEQLPPLSIIYHFQVSTQEVPTVNKKGGCQSYCNCNAIITRGIGQIMMHPHVCLYGVSLPLAHSTPSSSSSNGWTLPAMCQNKSVCSAVITSPREPREIALVIREGAGAIQLMQSSIFDLINIDTSRTSRCRQGDCSTDVGRRSANVFSTGGPPDLPQIPGS